MDTSLTQTLITPHKEAKLDSSELKTPPNTMGGNPPIESTSKRFSSVPTVPEPVAGNDSSGCFGISKQNELNLNSHAAVVDIPRQPIVRRRFSGFLCVLHLLAVMLAIWFLYAAVYTIYGILQ